MPPADARRVTDRPFEIFAGGSQRLIDRLAERKVRRDRGGKRAPRAVRVGSRQSRTAELEGSVVAADQIDRLGAPEMSALHHYDAWAKPEDSLRRRAHVAERRNRHPGQRLRF